MKIKKTGKNRYEFCSPANEQVVITNVEALYNFKNGFATFKVVDPSNKSKYKFGYINKYGKRINDKLYDHANNFENGLAIVKNGNLQNLISENGTELLSWSYSSVEKYVGKTFLIKFYSEENLELWGLINSNEEFILPAQYHSKIEVLLEAKKLLPEITKKWT